MQKASLVAFALVLVLGSAFVPITAPAASNDALRAVSEALPEYDGGYGYDPSTSTMVDNNGFAYSYRPDGVIRLELPWGYVTYFSFGLTGTYLGTPAIRTAMDYAWSWSVDVAEDLNASGVLEGYDYTFTADNLDGVLDWEIQLEFYHDAQMKVTHTMVNQYANPLTGVSFWYLFDLENTPAPYTIETSLGTVEGPLYQAIPDAVHWVRLSNEFQFDWRDALTDHENGMAYIGDGSVVGLPGMAILGISLEIGDVAAGGTFSVDPYFSGVTRTWNAGSASYAGIAANWDPVGVPATGDNITFDGTSTYNCNWNVSVVLGDFSMLSGYSGTVTQTVYFAVNDAYLESGTLYGSTTNYLTCAGDFIQTTGSAITDNKLMLNLTGAGSITKRVDSTLKMLRVEGTYTWVSSGGSTAGAYSIYIGSGGTLSITSGYTLLIATWSSFTYTNLGEIDGTGILRIAIQTYSISVSFGEINCPLAIMLYAPTINSCSVTMTGILSSSSSLTISSSHSTYTLALSTGAYALTCGNLVLSTRGIITQGTGTISCTSFVQSGVSSVIAQSADILCTGAWTHSAGTFTADSHDILIGGNMAVSGTAVWTPGTGQVVLYGTGKTLGTDDGQSFYDLKVNGTITTTSSVNVSHTLELTGTLNLAASKYLDFNVSGGGEWLNSGTLAGTGTAYLTFGSESLELNLGTVTAPMIMRLAAWGTPQDVILAVDTDMQGDLTVEDGVDLVPNDKVVTFVDDMTLNLSAASSLWNCTVEAGVTLTLAEDATVELRATVLGTVTGADFIEPEPAFLTSPDLTVNPLEVYSYTPDQLYWDTMAWEDYPSWLYVLDGTLTGVPSETDVGFANVSISLTWNDMVVYQNFTIFVSYTPVAESPWFTTVLGVVLSLVIGFGLLTVGMVFKMPYLVVFAGLVWIFAGVGVYSSINIAWTVLSTMLGFVLMIIGGTSYLED